MILIALIVLFFNAYLLFTSIRRTVIYNSRIYGLDTLNTYFDEGNYYEIYEKTIENKYTDREVSVDVSQYEAFGRYFHYYTLARMYDDPKYLDLMESEKEKITWKKILNVIDELENDMQ